MSMQTSTPHSSRDPRLYIDMIQRVTADYPNWDPLKKIQVGDYGTVNEDTGELDIEGNVYNDFPDQKELNPPIVGKPEDSYVVNSKDVARNELDPKSDLDVPSLAEASIKGEWEFHGIHNALLVMHRPQTTSIPTELLDYLKSDFKWRNKSVVTSLYACSGYFFFLSKGEKDTLKLALRTKDVGGNASTGWWQKHDTGIHKSGFNPDGHPIFIPLFNLKKLPTACRCDGCCFGPDRWYNTGTPWYPLDVDGEAWVDCVFDFESEE